MNNPQKHKSPWLLVGLALASLCVFSVTAKENATFDNRDNPTWLGVEASPTTLLGFGYYDDDFPETEASPPFLYIFTSKDGWTWTPRVGPLPDSDVLKLFYLNGQFVLTGGSGQLWRSTDGITWSADQLPTPVIHTQERAPLNSITYGNGRYVGGVLANRAVVISTNGQNWTYHEIAAQISEIQYGGDRFVATGNFPTSATAVSFDGITWVDSNIPYGPVQLDNYAYGNGMWVGRPSHGNQIYTSPDGIHWTKQADLPVTNDHGNASAYYTTTFVDGAFYIGTDYEGILRSVDGKNFNFVASSEFPFAARFGWISKVLKFQGLFFGLGCTLGLESLSPGGRLNSYDGITWSATPILNEPADTAIPLPALPEPTPLPSSSPNPTPGLTPSPSPGQNPAVVRQKAQIRKQLNRAKRKLKIAKRTDNDRLEARIKKQIGRLKVRLRQL